MLTFAGRKKFDAIVFKDFRKLNRNGGGGVIPLKPLV